MPQQICHKCSHQLKSSYRFIQQACKVSQEYLQFACGQEVSLDDVKNIEQLHESLIEIPETVYNNKDNESIKIEPFLTAESSIKIKEELEDKEEKK